MIKDLLVYIDNDESCKARVTAAAELARTCEAHLSGVYVRRRILIPAYAGVYIPAEVFKANEDMADELAAKAKQVFNSVCDEQGIEHEWFLEEGDVTQQVSMHARYTDMLITAQYQSDDPMLNESYRPDALVMAAGRPVLVLPQSGPVNLPAKRVMVAWNGGRESARALNDALPLLRHAKEVMVVNVNPRGDEPLPGADIARHLARHGLKVTTEAIPARDISVGDAILSRIADQGVDMLVMGGYGHSRLRETIIGGVTRKILEHMTVPVLFSH